MNQAPASVWRNPIHFLAFGLGSGASPWAPGTAGTLAAIPLFLLIQPLSLVWYGVFLLVTFLVGIYLCGQTSKDMGVHDHGGIVWDEFVGYWITMLAAPPGWLWIVIGFVLFRLFDIIKPWPISWADKKVAGGLGIMLDDVLAGLMALICLQLLTRLL
ncbi:phosphatidylglycerophosphatase A [Amphritea atlantica]|jgi:phosphatidylglycerophosphatase A|uniref:Phosphatidylglycerophosphatase A n=1 Tax=Amphritea atlantica TaxID=355243 RepID=A0A1H9EW74_9GAMM|nr:phosphatidylglycerophosphatase A [Amphritea atlantica]SEQ29238.1 phosphatidylglycerophosphatase A [Amphritea atlantica]